MEQQPGQDAHHQDYRQRLQRQYEPLVRVGDGKRSGATCQITEQELHACTGCRLKRENGACQQIKDQAELRDQYEQTGNDELQCNAPSSDSGSLA